MHSRALTRRRALAAAAATALAGAEAGRAHGGPPVFGPDEPFSPTRKDTLAGVVTRVISNSELEMRLADGATTVVSFAPGAVFWRDRRVQLGQFAPGEEVVVEGKHVDGSFVGTALVNLARPLEGRVTARDGKHIRTNAGSLRLTPATRYQRDSTLSAVPDAAVAPGADITALGRLDPVTGELVAVRLYG
jgi:hypothetical protein